MKSIIEIKNLTKQYNYQANTGATTVGEEIRNLFKFKRHKKDTFYALDNITFDIPQGECLGIIGRNGAGKSTLLKILSKITLPTSGHAIIRGSLSSILEVGTGFHPELTGRENIFLNGAMFGLSRQDLRSKFDEIVDFSGVEQFLDTPFKHYSSGMQIRLAFSIISHIESDIFILDEVLAVGDIDFQKKSMKKMQDIFKQGRTIIFVSQQQSMISTLTRNCLLLDNGKIKAFGPTPDITKKYFFEYQTSRFYFFNEIEPHPMLYARLIEAEITDLNGTRIKSDIDLNEPYKIIASFEILQNSKYNIEFVLQIKSIEGYLLFATYYRDFDYDMRSKGKTRIECVIPGNIVNVGQYYVSLSLITAIPLSLEHFGYENCLSFNIKNEEADKDEGINFYGEYTGYVRPKLKWKSYKL